MLDCFYTVAFSNAEVVGKIIHAGGVNEQLPLTTKLLITMPFNGEEGFSFLTLPQESLTISFSLSGFSLMMSTVKVHRVHHFSKTTPLHTYNQVTLLFSILSQFVL